MPATKSQTAPHVHAVSEMSNPTPMGTMKAVSAQYAVHYHPTLPNACLMTDNYLRNDERKKPFKSEPVCFSVDRRA